MAETVEAVPYDWPYDGAIDPSRMALLIIDMQHDLCGKGGYVDLMGDDISQTACTIAPIKAVLDTVGRMPGFAVIYTREGHRPDLADLPANCTGATGEGNYHAALKMMQMQGGVFGAVSTAQAFIEALHRLGSRQGAA